MSIASTTVSDLHFRELSRRLVSLVIRYLLRQSVVQVTSNEQFLEPSERSAPVSWDAGLELFHFCQDLLFFLADA